jgi:hypothetical protein
MGSYPQRCKVCGKRDMFNFTITDEVWNKVVPKPFQNRVVCLICFDTFASNKGINYAHAINKEVYFAGDKASFTMHIQSKDEAPID